MKTISRIVTGLMVVALGFPAVPALAGPSAGGLETSLAVAVLAQAPGGDRPDGRQSESGDLLRRAYQAMDERNFDAAESLISQAEELGVKYGVFHVGPTPKKARRDLKRLQEAAKDSPTRPSQLFPALPFGKKAPKLNPFAAGPGRRGDSPAEPGKFPGGLNSSAVTRLPPVGQVTAIPPATPEGSMDSKSPFGRAIVTTPPPKSRSTTPAAVDTLREQAPAGPDADGKANRARSDGLLLSARRALALGDVARATALVKQAENLNVIYGHLDDTPAKVETIIKKYNSLISTKADRKDSEAYRRQYARVFIEQAEGLFRWRNYDEAERLVNEAARQRVNYAPFEAQPGDLLKRIAAARESSPGTVAARTSTGGRAPSVPAPSAGPAPSMAAKQRAQQLARAAQGALAAGDLARAEDLAGRAVTMQVPDSAFAPGDVRPGLVLLEIQNLRRRERSGVMPASATEVTPATGRPQVGHTASHALYDRSRDTTRNVPAAAAVPGGSPPTPQPPIAAGQQGAGVVGGLPGVVSPGYSLFEQGEEALRARDVDRALDLFRQAAAHRDELDPLTFQRLQDHLQLLSSAGANGKGRTPAPSMIEDTAARQQVLIRKVLTDLVGEEKNAEGLQHTNPKGAVAVMEDARKMVDSAGLEPDARNRLLMRVDRKLGELRNFVEQNRPRIELDEQNQRVLQTIEREQQVKLDNQEKISDMVAEFNDLMHQQRYGEAEVVAKRAAELDPENAITQQLLLQAKFVRRFFNNLTVSNDREQGVIDQLQNVDIAAIGFDDNDPYRFPDVRQWEDLVQRRARFESDRGRHRTEKELEIEQKLKTPVSLQFEEAPLSEVMDYLATLAQVNLHLDPQGLAEEGVTSNDPVTITLKENVSLKSALNLILQPLHLSYVIKDEVLKVTSEQLVDGEVYSVTYNVADLVIPIPNFSPSPRMGLAGALHDAYGMVGFTGGGFSGGGTSPLEVMANNNGLRSGVDVKSPILAQTGSRGGVSGGSANMPLGYGPGGLGGGAQADFDSLIELITTTIQPTTWDDVGGPGSIKEFETNLSLVVSQTQDVHEEIVDLLEQLRRLQDLQVTIEVRFITLNDNFFERIGVDFDFDIDDKIDRPFQVFGRTTGDGDPAGGTEPGRNTLDVDNDRSVTVGMSAPGVFSADLDIPFTQNSFGLAIPQFGGFDASAGAQLGFAILSDIEAFFFINAAQGDKRTNVLQAPKVTLFNGQQAYVSDTSQSPFVISVIPVVGDFAAAQQPVIVVLSEGTFLTVQAVVSNDRRFVRLTVVPFFSTIGPDVPTFQFTGKTTSTDDTSQEGIQTAPNDSSKKSAKKTTETEGTTVQLPTFSYVTVTTTVSVPDGGTVLLGGIKRLNEGRSEFGVPMLNKIPYISRLFKNVGIGRETQSLMMMVTPRIIIQEEEEERLGILP